MNDCKKIIQKLNLEPHPEGGYFKEVYRSSEIIPEDALPERFIGDRSYSTSIYYLLKGDQFSTFHRLKADEIWHHYDGSAIELHIISPNAKYEKIVLGKTIDEGEVFQHTVQNGCWFAAIPVDKNSYSLIGATVSPGFDFNDFEIGDRKELITKYPKYKNIIKKLTKG